MSLAEQRSTQRLMEELMSELGPGSPRGSPTFPSPPASFRTKHNKHIDRLRREGYGHRRTHSSPGGSMESETRSDMRTRTLSGDTFGRGGTMTAPVTPAFDPIRLPLAAARSVSQPAYDDTGRLDDIPPVPSLPVNPAQPLMPLPPPPQGRSSSLEPNASDQSPGQRSDHPPLAVLETQLEPKTLAPTPQVRITRSSHPPLSSPPSSLALPSLPTRSPEKHPFAHVVGLMEKSDSPSKRRSQNLPTLDEKGKQSVRGDDEREGRQQTVRRGFIGSGGIMHRIASSQSLNKVKSSLPFGRTQPSPSQVTLPTFHPSQLPSGSRSQQSLLSSNPLPPLSPAGTSPRPTPTTTTFLRPAPPPPTSDRRHPVFAPSARAPSTSPSRTRPLSDSHPAASSPVPSRQQSLVPSAVYALPSPYPRPTSTQPPHTNRSPTRNSHLTALGLPAEEFDMVEIPRFKKRELNLGLIRKHPVGQRLAWLMLGAAWLVNGLVGIFFDVNVLYILIQCITHPSFETNSSKSWTFAAAAYGILWGISTIVVWLGWELGFEFWRRWRLDRPAIEPIYFSFPASLHLSLISYDHFLFLLHIRTSPLSTPYAKDIIPETCHSLIQLLPGLIVLLPRAAIALVILIAFWSPEQDVQASYGGSVDDTSDRDSNFFKSNGELTGYAKGVLMTFTIYTASRLLVVISSAIGLWLFSGHPFGGRFGPVFSSNKDNRSHSNPPETPRKPKTSYQRRARDPNLTHSPQKGGWGVDNENEFVWDWRERTRARVQDAFELCIVRPGSGPLPTLERGESRGNEAGFVSRIGGAGHTMDGEEEEERILDTDFGNGSQVFVPWGRSVRGGMDDASLLHRQQLPHEDFHPHRERDRYRDGRGVKSQGDDGDPEKIAIRRDRFSAEEYIEQITEESPPPTSSTKKSQARPESTLDPIGTSQRLLPRPTPSRADTAATNSSNDLFYTPTQGNTPNLEKTRSVAEGLHMTPLDTSTGGVRGPPSAFKPSKVITDFGVVQNQPRGDTPNSDEGSGEGDESTGLLSASTSTRGSIHPRDRGRERSGSNVSRLSRRLSVGLSHHTGSHSSSSSNLSGGARKRAHTNAHSPSLDMARARSSSITMLKESLSQGSLMRRARSGTVSSLADAGIPGGVKRYQKIEGEESEEEIDNDFSPVTPRSRADKSMGLPFEIPGTL